MRRFNYDLIDSTNSEARRLAARHPGERLLVTAARQAAGRGRHGRVWHSPPGGAWMSIAWPMMSGLEAYAAASLAAAVALRRAIRDVTAGMAADLRIKWPNDLLIADRKVAGILCEQSPAERGAGGILIIGIGVNVDFDPALLTAEVRHPATTLRAAIGGSASVEEVIEAVSRHLAGAMEAYERGGLGAGLLAELRAHLAYVGTVRTWNSPRGKITGRVLGVDDAGRLLIEGENGRVACEVGEFVTTHAEG